MYAENIVLKYIGEMKNGVSISSISRKTGISHRTLYSWKKGKIPHKQEFPSRKEYLKNYYQTHKEDYKKRGLKNRFGGNGLKVLERDNYCCTTCDRKNRLLIHHIDLNEENNEEENLVVLCKPCHDTLHWVLRYPKIKILLSKGIPL